MDANTVFLVLNPVSGISQPEFVRNRFEAVFQAAGWNTRVYETTGKESIAEVVRQAVKDGVSMVVAAGGDGTVSAVGSGITYSDVPLGILPTGTWNALSHNIGIPILFEDALRLLVNPHRVMKMDGLEINRRIYLLNVGIGLSAAVMQSTQRQQKRRFGFLAYLWNLVIKTSVLSLQQFRLRIDGKESKIRATELMVVNGSILGMGELPTVLEIRPDDGKVEILALRAPSALGLVKIIFNFLIGRRKRTRGFLSFTAMQTISIRTRRKAVVEADGEIIGYTPLEIQLRPGAVQVIIP
jgi:diacylglycerol kinase (ATP)